MMSPLLLIATLCSVGRASTIPSATVAAPSDYSNTFYSDHNDGPHSLSTPADADGIEEHLKNSASAALMTTTLIDQGHRAISSKKCENNEQHFKLDLSTDGYGFENSWKLLKNTKNGPKELYSGPPGDKKYDKEERYVGVYCLSPGTYKFVIYDIFKDGMCCSFGQGKYSGYVGNTKVFSSPDGDADWEKRGHQFNISSGSKNELPFDPKIGMGLASRDQEWLDSHNTRRKRWHGRYGKSYVPLKWSQALSEESKRYAKKLAKDCSLKHDPNTSYGENIALNYGSGSFAKMRPTDNILTRFVENEADDEYPANGHLTQVLWRATKYVGCGDASWPYNGGTCHAQVCRYSRPGNCNMNSFKSNKNDWWLTPMLMTESPCDRECSPDGCE
eukprot:CAMPEP_0172571812 /NCGR_PEP_ID=MMETSP1067-20121228/132666_1 /TAXON_ID=265564 ORGANISM="Thalassiosira punctigera, Strain Tpunct2005C2" /NCGR_SAMPLE_ID=MMETSP1067 /ASSEMBLY_ACC=CAM_ASM_000444 /LENGTH=387 /DNA_ID=CAMNT_0013364225 /DNA_START=182 /DNA_END=1345 /DNA_ORIENTATION=-